MSGPLDPDAPWGASVRLVRASERRGELGRVELTTRGPQAATAVALPTAPGELARLVGELVGVLVQLHAQDPPTPETSR